MGLRKWNDAEWLFLWESYNQEDVRTILADNDKQGIPVDGKAKKGRAKDHRDGGMKKAAKLIYDK